MGIRITVRAKPGASRNRVGGSYGPDAALVVAVTARAVDGKANEAVLRAVSVALGCRAADVRLVSGHLARTKVLEVDVTGADEQRVRDQLAVLLAE